MGLSPIDSIRRNDRVGSDGDVYIVAVGEAIVNRVARQRSLRPRDAVRRSCNGGGQSDGHKLSVPVNDLLPIQNVRDLSVAPIGKVLGIDDIPKTSGRNVTSS